jgi:hypothetical protein
MSSKSPAPQAEFSRPVAADHIGAQESEWEIAADAAERQRLAARFALLALERLTAVLRLRRSGSGLIHLRGRFEADVVQACVVTLEPVRSRVAESFALTFTTRRGTGGGEVVIDLDAEDPPEELTDGHIDLGETVVQQLAVALDPYPRAPGAEGVFEAAERRGRGDDEAANTPFAVLGGWRKE